MQLRPMSAQSSSGTEFEKPRGVSLVEVRGGFSQVHLTALSDPLPESRLEVLRAVANAGVSLDFLKLTQGGLSFLVDEAVSEKADRALASCGASVSIQRGCGIVTIHAVNIRDEEGLISRLVSVAIREGTSIEHLADMHDRLLLVTDEAQAARLAEVYKREFLGGAS